MDFTCFSSSDPAAHRASLLFDFYNDDENLWSRSSSDVPLPSCSSSPPPPDSRCLVCVQHAVSAVCRNLADGVKVMLEAGADQVQISKSECPELLSDDAPQWQIPVAIALVFTFIVIVGVSYFFWKRCRKPREQSGEETGGVQPDVMMMETEIDGQPGSTDDSWDPPQQPGSTDNSHF